MSRWEHVQRLRMARMTNPLRGSLRRSSSPVGRGDRIAAGDAGTAYWLIKNLREFGYSGPSTR